jgi:DNA modification methylase
VPAPAGCPAATAADPLAAFLPEGLGDLGDPRRAIPRLARDERLTGLIEAALPRIPTTHRLHLGDARVMPEVAPGSVHLVLTSPPYWILKRYNPVEGQLGHIAGYEEFLAELDKVWRRCFTALVPGGRLVCVAGDVCLARRRNRGRHTVVPLHAAIQERCRAIGYDNLAPILWHKIANARLEAAGNGAAFLGKPYEPNAVLKNDVEFILMQRKPGGYRKPDLAAKLLSVVPERRHREWFRSVWTGLPGASTRDHPAPFPLELATRLVRMFSFVGDVVLDPFLGTGTTAVAAALAGRTSVGYEIDPEYLALAHARLVGATAGPCAAATVELHRGGARGGLGPHACGVASGPSRG